MKKTLKIIKILDKGLVRIQTRQTIENLIQSLQMTEDNIYVFDMSGVVWISRGAADELYNNQLGRDIELINMNPTVAKMMEIVTLSRTKPIRDRDWDVTERIFCDDYESLSKVLKELDIKETTHKC